MEAGRLTESWQNCNPGWQEWLQVQTTTDCRALPQVTSALTLLYHVVRLAVSNGLSPDYRRYYLRRMFRYPDIRTFKVA